MNQPELPPEEDPRIAKLKDLFPEAFLDGVPDLTPLKDMLGLTDSDETGERYGLSWNGKKQAKDSLKRSPKGALLTDLENSVDFDNAENIFIEGDNLEVLKLLQRGYNDKIKLIYIDPPYNTGNDFVYNDDFSDSLKTYLEYTNQKDADGMATSATLESGGRKHSGWLSMMYPRLVLARNLLSQDGIIFVSIDDNEVHNLRHLLDTVFGQENFVVQFVWKRRAGGGSDSKHVSTDTEYIICYARDIGFLELEGELSNSDGYTKKDKHEKERGPYLFKPLDNSGLNYSESLDFPISAPDGSEIWPGGRKGKPAIWQWGKDKVKWGFESDFLEIKQTDNGYKVYKKQYLFVDNSGKKIERRVKPRNLILQPLTREGGRELKSLVGESGFSYPKPSDLIRQLIAMVPDRNLVVLDFFAGSGTTAHAVMAQNAADGGSRKFILVNLPEPTPEDSAARDDGFENICDITRLRIKKSAESVGVEDFNLRCFKLGESNFKKWNDRPLGEGESSENFLDELSLFVETRVDGASGDGVVAEVLVGEGVSLDVPWERLSVAGADVVKVGGVAVCLADGFSSGLTEGLLGLSGVEKLVVLEDSFVDAESEKVNLSLGCEKADIVLRSV
jgi:adenine-specific DNA-methyltransferase